MGKLITVKVLQEHPIRYGNKDYEKDAEFEIEEVAAKWLLENKRIEVVSLKTSEDTNTTLSKEEKEAKILEAIRKLLKEEPEKVPTVDKVKSEAGLKVNVSASERDVALEKVKAEIANNNQGE